ncbi:MAG: YeeE/YedE family protein [Bacteroidia bacterium]|nr:YeeE/YedE family protein [Bacteroidia bacterium]MCZ2443759.1 YeeE/YedE family protein [Flavobacteriales bacterium]
MKKNLKYILLGFYFGFILIKFEAVSWYRIVELFHFQSFHLFGVIGSAALTGIISVLIIKSIHLTTIKDEPIDLKTKPLLIKANFFGGVLFGLGWSLVGACTAPLFIHLGSGNLSVLFVLLFVFVGTLVYGSIKNHLPH